MKLVKLILSLMILTTFVLGQVSVNTYGVSPRVVGLDSTDIYDVSFSGLNNVGVGSKVFVRGVVEDSAGLQNATWSVEGPSGTVTTGTTLDVDKSWYDSHGEEWTYKYTQISSFMAETEGKYTIIFTDDKGADTVVVNAAKYLGIDGGVGCGTCHGDTKTAWEGTGHSDMLERGLEGTLSSHYGEGCISCHTVGYDKNADNDGFDDFDFVFPDSLYEGKYAEMEAAYPDAMARANIQCESCHGPGSMHNGQTSDAKMVSDVRTDGCALCHDDGHYHTYPEQWDVSGHGSESTLYDSGYAGGSCAKCHNGQGFVNSVKGVSETLTVKIPISCATCHDPHDATNEHQLRNLDVTLSDETTVVTGGGNGKLCVNCHKGRRNSTEYATDMSNLSSHYGPHYGIQGDMLLAGNLATYGEDFASSGHWGATTNGCVDCHMAAADVPEGEHIAHTGGHTFAMSNHGEDDNMKSCEPCHGGSLGASFNEVQFYWNGTTDHDGDGTSEGLQEEVHGLMNQLATLLPPEGEATLDYSILKDSTVYTETKGIAYYNYMWVEEDRSGGIHNPKLTIDMLTKSIEALGGVVNVNNGNDVLPTEYALEQNYPNPFNPSTTIKYTVPQQSNVKLVVFDALGKEVATLVNQSQTAGTYVMRWNAANMASGIYFYRLQADNFMEVKKMLLLK